MLALLFFREQTSRATSIVKPSQAKPGGRQQDSTPSFLCLNCVYIIILKLVALKMENSTSEKQPEAPLPNWFAVVMHTDGLKEYARLHQIKDFDPKSAKDFVRDQKYGFTTNKWLKDGKPHGYKVYIGAIASTYSCN
jgi:hypothetical protein